MSFALPVLEYCSAVWCSAADSHLKILDRVVRSFVYLAGGFQSETFPIDDLEQRFECYIRFGVTQCILRAVNRLRRMCRRMLLLLLWLLIASLTPPRCSNSQFHRTFVLFSVSLWNDLSDPVFDGVGLAGFKSRANDFLLA